MAYQPTPTVKKGGRKRAVTADNDVQELLKEVLRELKIINVQLQEVTGSAVPDGDLEG